MAKKSELAIPLDVSSGVSLEDGMAPNAGR